MSRRNRLQSMIIASLTRLAIRRHRWVIGLSLLVAIISVAMMFWRVQFKTHRVDLVNPNSKFQKDWLRYATEFGAHDDVLVIVNARDPVRIRRVIDELGRRLRQHPDLFQNVYDRFEQDRLVSKGMYFLPYDQLLSLEQLVQQWIQLLDNSATHPSIWQSAFHPNSSGSSAWSELLRKAVADPTGYQFPWSLNSIEKELRERIPSYSVMSDGQLGIVSLHLVIATDEFARGRKPITVLRQIVDDVSNVETGAQLGITGLPIIEYDEMATSEQDMTRASLITLGMVTLLFAVGFGNVRYPICAVAGLLIGIMWTCGYLTLSLGHLNILSMSFGVILIGLGVDFSIHYVARFLSLRRAGVSVESSIRRTAIGAGPAIVAGGISTALAFFATGVAEFLGVAELGIIAGGGILLCVLATLLVLPALLSLPHHSHHLVPPLPQTLWSNAASVLWRRPHQTVAWGVGITVFLALGMTRLEYDHNLLNLQAGHLESVAWERRLLAESNGSVWHAVSIADSVTKLKERRNAFLQLDTVDRVEDLSALLPTTNHTQQNVIRRIHDLLDQVNPQPPAIAPLTIDQIPPELISLGSRAFGEGSPNTSDNTSKPEWLSRIDLVRARLLTDVWTQLQAIKRISNPEAPDLDDIPPAIRSRFVGKSGKRILRVYARDDIWQTTELEQFVNEVTRVDAEITGAPIQAFYASRQMKESYLNAAGYAAIAVFAVLWWDLRKLNLVLLAALPTLLGLAQLFGIMGLLQIPLNPANVIVLPLVLGIGIDDGIHVVHDLRLSSKRRALRSATINGIVMTSLTSMVGFGSLMLAQHEGLRSLGRVVTLGIACCLISSTLWLPCLLAILSATSHRRVRSGRIGNGHHWQTYAGERSSSNSARKATTAQG